MEIKKVLIPRKLKEYLEKRQLLKQYQKQIIFLKEGNFKNIDFKLREPKDEGIYYFRINKQFRALGVITEEENTETGKFEKKFTVTDISNHQE